MNDTTSPPVDPNAPPDTPFDFGSYMDKVGKNFGNMGTNSMQMGLLGLGAGLGKAMMPSRMPVPFGAALGMGAEGLMGGESQALHNQGLQTNTRGQQIQNQVAAATAPAQIGRANAAAALYADPNYMDNLKRAASSNGQPPSFNPDGSPQTQPGQQSNLAPGVARPSPAPGGGAFTSSDPAKATLAAFQSIPDQTARAAAYKAATDLGMGPEEIQAWVAGVQGESGWKNVNSPTNKNGTTDHGYGQVNDSWIGSKRFPNLTPQNVNDPQTNLSTSAAIFHDAYTRNNGKLEPTYATYNGGAPTSATPAYTPTALNTIAGWNGGNIAPPDGTLTKAQADALSNWYLQQSKNGALATSLGMANVYGDPAENAKAANRYRDYSLAPGQAAQTRAATQPFDMQSEAFKTQLGMQATQAQQEREAKLKVETAGPVALAVAQNSASDLKPGGERLVPDGKGGMTSYKNPELKEVTNPDGSKSYQYMSNPSATAPAGTPGTSVGVVTPGGGSATAELSPMAHGVAKAYGEKLAHNLDDIDNAASSAINTNYTFDNIRQAAKGITPGAFAGASNDVRKYVSGALHSMLPQDSAVLNSDTFKKYVDTPLANYVDLEKNTGSLTREAVHAVSPRASQQEFSMVQNSLVSAKTPEDALRKVSDQWQGLNDYAIARQQVAHQYLNNGKLADFETDFNNQVSPTVFMMNRMLQSPEGQKDWLGMLTNLQQTDQGKALVAKLQGQYNWARDNKLFSQTPAQQ